MALLQPFCSAPHIKESFFRLQNVKKTLPTRTLITIAMPQLQPRQYTRPRNPTETRPLDASRIINRSTGALDETYVCGKHFLKRTSKEVYFTVLSSFYSPAVGRAFDVVHDGHECSAKMSEADLKNLLEGAVEVLIPGWSD
jgi:hypothetical protein